MSESTYLTYYQRNQDVILNRAKDYYENDKERLRKQARDKYRNLSEEEKNKKWEYEKNWYRNMSEDKKKRLKEYQKKCCLNIIMNSIFFLLWLNCACYLFSCALLNPYIYTILNRPVEIKA